MLHSLLLSIVVSSAHAGFPEQSLAQTPLTQLYTQDHSASAKTKFFAAFFSLLPVLREHNLNLNRWFREDHIIYLADYISDDEKLAMIPIFIEIQKRVEAGQHDMKTALIGAGPAFLMAKAGKIDLEVLKLKEQHKDVIRFALSKHEFEIGQTYGVLPYSYHLRNVRGVLKRFGFGPKNSFFALKLGTAAWLHDVIEDTDATYEQIKELFGEEIADIVRGVTKIEKRERESSENHLRRTYERCAQNKGSRILKVADRIANVEEGLLGLFSGEKSKVQKYFAEQPMFRSILYVPGEADEMWNHLDRLLTDQVYAQQWAAANLFKKCETAVTQ